MRVLSRSASAYSNYHHRNAAVLWCGVICASIFIITSMFYFLEKTPAQSESGRSISNSTSRNDRRGYPFGVNLWGWIRAEFGLGEATRGVVAALLAADIPVRIIDAHYTLQNLSVSMRDHTFDDYTTNENKPIFYFNIVHVNPSPDQDVKKVVSERFGKNRYTIGIWWWETEHIPDSWKSAFGLYDEIWAGTNFIRDAIHRTPPRAPIPVSFFRFPLASLTEERSDFELLPRSHFNLTDEDFIFFFNFDFQSTVDRKNPNAVIEAYRLFEEQLHHSTYAVTTGTQKKVRKPILIIKYNNLYNHARYKLELDYLVEASEGSRVLFLGRLTPREVHSIFKLIDCYVSLHRAEGFGLGIAQAMSNFKPCIVTNYSGSTDFAFEKTAYLVPYEKVQVSKTALVYGAESGHEWAEPNVTIAAQHMMTVYKHPDQAKKVAAYARAFISKHYRPKPCGDKMRMHLERLYSMRESLAYYFAQKNYS